ncbi:MAG: hypothetical protein M9965_08010 [Anaerolineae bacterium]|nr:hypothetical protein [Anaerolineae bacterium]
MNTPDTAFRFNEISRPDIKGQLVVADGYDHRVDQLVSGSLEIILSFDAAGDEVTQKVYLHGRFGLLPTLTGTYEVKVMLVDPEPVKKTQRLPKIRSTDYLNQWLWHYDHGV